MKDQNKYLNIDNFIENKEKNGKGKVNYKYFSSKQTSPNRTQESKNLFNKIEIKELTKLSDRPDLVNKYNQKISNKHFISEDKSNEKNAKSFSMVNNRILKFRNEKEKKNIVIFTERPKKISDYILKNNSKKKVYRLTYLNEEALNFQDYLDEKIKKNYNSNKNNKRKAILNRNYNYNTYNEYKNYLISDLYKYTNSSNRVKSSNSKTKNLYANNQNNDKSKVVKIQSFWRGYYLRKFLVKRLKSFYKILKIFNTLYIIFYNNNKSSFKKLFHLLSKKKNKTTYNNPYNIKLKNKIAHSSTNFDKTRNSKLNKNTNKTSKENLPIITVIDKKNINLFIPGEIKKPTTKKNFIYRRQTNPKNCSPIVAKKTNIKKQNNIKLKAKAKNYDGFKNINYKNKIRNGTNIFYHYIIKKNLLLYYPLFLYRMRILSKMKLVEHRYKCLFNLIKIKKKIYLHNYFQKYRNIIFSKTLNQIFSNNPINASVYVLNYNNNKDENNSNQNNKENIINKIDNSSQNILKNANNLNNNHDYDKIIILKKIISKIESKTQKESIKNIYYKWKDLSKDIFVIPKLSDKRNKHNLMNYKCSVLPKKKFIKVRKVKNDYTNAISHIKSMNSGKILAKSFESDNVNIRKMKIKKISLLESNEIENKELNLKQKSNEIGDNGYFIQKMANIIKKIRNKNNVCKYFIYWKKKAKQNK